MRVNKNKKFGLLIRYEEASLSNLHKKTPAVIRKILVKHRNISKEKFYKDGLSFFIASSQRIGKTWMLHAIANNIIERFEEKSVWYTTSTALQKGFVNFFDLDKEENFISILAGKKFLFIDDMGLEYKSAQSGFVRAKMESFLRWRMSNNKITYIASKIYGEDFVSFYADSLYDFILGEYVDIFVEVDSEFNIGKIVLEEKLNK